MALSRSSLLPLSVFLLFSSGVDADSSCIVNPCYSDATVSSGVVFFCPAGDGESFEEKNLVISVTVRGCANTPVSGVPTTDIFVSGCTFDLLPLCGGDGGSGASAPTDANGQTTITGSFAVGGCSLDGIRVLVQGVTIGWGCGDACLPVKVKTPDLDRNLVVNLVDLATFGAGYSSPPKPYNECIDFTAPFGTITIADFAKYGVHSNHSC